MFKKLFGHDTQFYDLLEAGAAETKVGAAHASKLLSLLGHGSPETTLGDIAQSRRKHKRIAQDTTEAVTRTFVTPIEREDIEALSNSLYKISKTIEKVSERLTICPPGTKLDNAAKEFANIEQATAIVQTLVGFLRKGANLDSIKDSYDRIQSLEGNADKEMTRHLQELYHTEQDARLLIYWKDLYELLEKITDRCRDVGNEVFRIILKNS